MKRRVLYLWCAGACCLALLVGCGMLQRAGVNSLRFSSSALFVDEQYIASARDYLEAISMPPAAPSGIDAKIRATVAKLDKAILFMSSGRGEEAAVLVEEALLQVEDAISQIQALDCSQKPGRCIPHDLVEELAALLEAAVTALEVALNPDSGCTCDESFDHDDGEWVEYDPDGKLILDYSGSERLLFNHWIRYEPGYVYRPCSAGDFVLEFDIQITNCGGNARVIGPGLSDGIGSIEESQNGIFVVYYAGFPTKSPRLSISTRVNGVQEWGGGGNPPQPNRVNISMGVPYYVRLEKVGGSLTLSVFSDPARTIHASGSPKTVATTLASTQFGTLYAINGFKTSPAGNWEWTAGWIDNVRVDGEPAAPLVNRRALIVVPFAPGTPGYSSTLRERLDEPGWETTSLGFGDPLLMGSFEQAMGGQYDLIHITTHSGGNSIAIEAYDDSLVRDSRLAALQAVYGTDEDGQPLVFPMTVAEKTDKFAISVGGSFITRYFQPCAGGTLVYVEGCNTGARGGGIREAFLAAGATAFVGFDDWIYFCPGSSACLACTAARQVSQHFYGDLHVGASVRKAATCNCGCSTSCMCGKKESCLASDGCVEMTLHVP